MQQTPLSLTAAIIYGRPERLLRVGSVSGNGAATSGVMTTGPWMLGPEGTPSAGSLGVLVDDVFGYAVMAAKPEGLWGVSTDIFVEFCAPLPTDGSPLRAEGELVQLDQHGGLGRGRVFDADGTVVAIGTERLRFVPGTPMLGAGQPDDEPLGLADGALDLFAGEVRATDAGVVLEFDVVRRLANPLGNVHGGLLFYASEVAGLLALRAGGTPFITTSVHISYLRPAGPSQRMSVEATIDHRGRTVGIASVVARNAAGKPCTIATVTGHAVG
ncbi:MAG: PaaI family thioesterase [Naasia sp.]|nr:PaaI family thioesterase [Naasia sp.]